MEIILIKIEDKLVSSVTYKNGTKGDIIMTLYHTKHSHAYRWRCKGSDTPYLLLDPIYVMTHYS